MEKYVRVADDLGNIVEIPTEEDETISLNTLISQFVGASGLKYQGPSGYWRALRIEDKKIYPPKDVPDWHNIQYNVVQIKENKRKIDDCINEDAIKVRKKTFPKKCNDLIVLGLNPNTTGESLKKTFLPYGDVILAEVKRDLKSGKSKGYGFIRFSSYESQLKVLMKKINIDGRWCVVKLPDSKGGNAAVSGSKIFVGGVDNSMTAEDLKTFFESSFDTRVVDVFFVPTKNYAFVTFLDWDTAHSLYGESFEINGKSVFCRPAEPIGEPSSYHHYNNNHMQSLDHSIGSNKKSGRVIAKFIPNKVSGAFFKDPKIIERPPGSKQILKRENISPSTGSFENNVLPYSGSRALWNNPSFQNLTDDSPCLNASDYVGGKFLDLRFSCTPKETRPCNGGAQSKARSFKHGPSSAASTYQKLLSRKKVLTPPMSISPKLRGSGNNIAAQLDEESNLLNHQVASLPAHSLLPYQYPVYGRWSGYQETTNYNNEDHEEDAMTSPAMVSPLSFRLQRERPPSPDTTTDLFDNACESVTLLDHHDGDNGTVHNRLNDSEDETGLITLRAVTLSCSPSLARSDTPKIKRSDATKNYSSFNLKAVIDATKSLFRDESCFKTRPPALLILPGAPANKKIKIKSNRPETDESGKASPLDRDYCVVKPKTRSLSFTTKESKTKIETTFATTLLRDNVPAHGSTLSFDSVLAKIKRSTSLELLGRSFDKLEQLTDRRRRESTSSESDVDIHNHLIRSRSIGNRLACN